MAIDRRGWGKKGPGMRVDVRIWSGCLLSVLLLSVLGTPINFSGLDIHQVEPSDSIAAEFLCFGCHPDNCHGHFYFMAFLSFCDFILLTFIAMIDFSFPTGPRNIKQWRSADGRQDKVLKITVYILIHDMNNRMMAASYHYPHCIMTSLHRTLCRVERLWTVFRRWIRSVQCGW